MSPLELHGEDTPPGSGVVTVRSSGLAADYPVFVRRGILDELDQLVEAHAPAHRYAVIADETVAGLYGDRVVDVLARTGRPIALLTFPAGEEHKNRDEWARMTDALLEAQHGRDSAVVALGGGVTGDLAGFVAATFLRGIPVVQVPTSLVAMVDSSVGGKTGIDASTGKNLVGAFHPPRFVAADPDVVTTLPRAERAQGLAEAVKHGAILDAEYMGFLEREGPALMDGEPSLTERAVQRSVEIKGEVVSRDEREGGLRQVLNFGHTLGHALEAASRYRLPHGSAVSVGMVLEAGLGETLGVSEAGTEECVRRALVAFGLPTTVPPGLALDEALAFMRSDKKAREGRVRFVLLREPGEVARDPVTGWSREVPAEVVGELLDREMGGPQDRIR
jgi:3-dehydroquinate synthase